MFILESEYCDFWNYKKKKLKFYEIFLNVFIYVVKKVILVRIGLVMDKNVFYIEKKKIFLKKKLKVDIVCKLWIKYGCMLIWILLI